MEPKHLQIFMEVVVLLLAISVHESAHAWMANRCGDPTARMLGRISLNPIKHIDPLGTILLPLVAMLTHIPVLGWAKPTPVDPRNFRRPVLDDILTSVVGPISNFIVASGAVLILALISLTSQIGHFIVQNMPRAYWTNNLDVLAARTNSLFMPISLLAYELLVINVVLGVFNLIPVPPLDGSHVLRHMLSNRLRDVYDRIGIFGLILLLLVGGNLIMAMMSPFLSIFNSLLMRV